MNAIDQQPLLITGASGGLGLAIAEYLIQAGYRSLALHYNSHSEDLISLVNRHQMDPKKTVFQADLTSESSVKSLGEQVRSAHGAIWGLVHFAGSTSNGMSWKLSLEEFNRVIHANLTSTFLTCREFIPGMREANGGRIITISSIVAFSGIAGAAHYSASKAGVVGLTKSLALELASKKITVNALALGYFNHGMIHTVPENLRAQIRTRIPTDRFGEADEIGGMLKYLLSADGAFLTGQTLHINGGQYV